jgi:hypothetical protein
VSVHGFGLLVHLFTCVLFIAFTISSSAPFVSLFPLLSVIREKEAAKRSITALFIF